MMYINKYLVLLMEKNYNYKIIFSKNIIIKDFNELD
jgi:hypothetical protein